MPGAGAAGKCKGCVARHVFLSRLRNCEHGCGCARTSFLGIVGVLVFQCARQEVVSRETARDHDGTRERYVFGPRNWIIY